MCIILLTNIRKVEYNKRASKINFEEVGIVKMKKVYPVILTQAEDCILIEVPDLEILTQGKDLADAIEMARDAIGLTIITMQDKGRDIPIPSIEANINMKAATFAEDGVNMMALVDIDVEAYRRKYDNKTVRRNVTLPNWLNKEAEKAHLNVSRVLQEALMLKLGVSR